MQLNSLSKITQAAALRINRPGRNCLGGGLPPLIFLIVFFLCGCGTTHITVTSDPPGAKAHAGPFTGSDFTVDSTETEAREQIIGETPAAADSYYAWNEWGHAWAWVEWPDGTRSEKKIRKPNEGSQTEATFDFRKSDYEKRALPEADLESSALSKLSAEDRRKEIVRLTDVEWTPLDVFKLRPAGRLSVADVNDAIITWKNHHLDRLLREAKTPELRDYVDQIEHTVLEATDASEREKDEAQRLVAGGANGDRHHTDLARAYRLRIEVLKPILAAFKEEIANRGK